MVKRKGKYKLSHAILYGLQKAPMYEGSAKPADYKKRKKKLKSQKLARRNNR